jgi:thioredoxin 1
MSRAAHTAALESPMPYTAVYAEVEPARADVDALPGLTVLEFGAPWCPHCIGAQPHIEAVLSPRDDLRHLKIEDGPGRPLGRSHRIKLWPSVLILRDGEELARVVRPTSREEIERVLPAG